MKKKFFHFQKSYVRSFTLALQYECKPYGIDVQLLSPNFVATKLNHFSPFVMGGIPGVIPNAETYGRSAVFTLGKTDDTTGYFGHAIQVIIFSSILGVFVDFLIMKDQF